jgi:hypothetical protein
MFLTGIRRSVSSAGPKENVDTLNDDHSQVHVRRLLAPWPQSDVIIGE